METETNTPETDAASLAYETLRSHEDGFAFARTLEKQRDQARRELAEAKERISKALLIGKADWSNDLLALHTRADKDAETITNVSVKLESARRTIGGVRHENERLRGEVRKLTELVTQQAKSLGIIKTSECSLRERAERAEGALTKLMAQWESESRDKGFYGAAVGCCLAELRAALTPPTNEGEKAP